MFGPINMGMSAKDAREAAMDALKMVGAENLVDRMPNYLSGGQKRFDLHGRRTGHEAPRHRHG